MLFKNRLGAIGDAVGGERSSLLLLFLDVIGEIAERLEMVCQLQESIIYIAMAFSRIRIPLSAAPIVFVVLFEEP